MPETCKLVRGKGICPKGCVYPSNRRTSHTPGPKPGSHNKKRKFVSAVVISPSIKRVKHTHATPSVLGKRRGSTITGTGILQRIKRRIS